MMRTVIAALALGMLVQAPASTPTASGLIERNLQAKGGLEKIKSVQTMRMTGRMTVPPGTEAPFVMEIKRPNKMRMEFTLKDATAVQAFDGKTGWQMLPFAGQKEPQVLPPGATRPLAQQADFDGPLVDAAAKGHTVHYVGMEKLDTGEAYRLQLKLKTGETRDIFLDAGTFLEVRGEGKAGAGTRTMEMVSLMGDYKQVDGLMLPHRLETGPKGSDKMLMSIDKIELNVPIDDARFAMPAKEKG